MLRVLGPMQAVLQRAEPSPEGSEAAATMEAERSLRLDLGRRKGPRVEPVTDEAVKMEQ